MGKAGLSAEQYVVLAEIDREIQDIGTKRVYPPAARDGGCGCACGPCVHGDGHCRGLRCRQTGPEQPNAEGEA